MIGKKSALNLKCWVFAKNDQAESESNMDLIAINFYFMI